MRVSASVADQTCQEFCSVITVITLALCTVRVSSHGQAPSHKHHLCL